MLWLVTLGAFLLWLVGALADFGGDFIDLLLVVPVAVFIFELWPRHQSVD
jgi:hypothetical protein